MRESNFLLIKNHTFPEIKSLNGDGLTGFSFKPRNKIIKNGVNVKKLVMFNPSFTETILRKKIKNRLEIYLKFIISVLDDDNDDSTDITDLRAALNDLTRYKSIIRNKYFQYLEERYAEMLMKKIELLEQELKSRIAYYQPKEYNNENRRSK